jgi:hypothetical protein
LSTIGFLWAQILLDVGGLEGYSVEAIFLDVTAPQAHPVVRPLTAAGPQLAGRTMIPDQ